MHLSNKLKSVYTLQDAQSLFEFEVKRISRVTLYRESETAYNEKVLSIMNEIYEHLYNRNVTGQLAFYDTMTYEALCLSKRTRRWRDPDKSMVEYKRDVRFFKGLYTFLVAYLVGLYLLSQILKL